MSPADVIARRPLPRPEPGGDGGCCGARDGGRGRVRRERPTGRPAGADHPAAPGPGAGRTAHRHVLRRPPVGHLWRPALRAGRGDRQPAAAGRRGDRRGPGRRRGRRAPRGRRTAGRTWSASRASTSSPATTSTSWTPGRGCGTCPPWASTCCATSGSPSAGGPRPSTSPASTTGRRRARACPGTARTSTRRSTDATTPRRWCCSPTSRCMVEQARAAGVDLQLSGHTHGGQLWPFDYVIRLDQPAVEGLTAAREHPAVRHVGAPATGGRRCGSVPGRRSPSWSCAPRGSDRTPHRSASASKASSTSSSSLRSPLQSAHASRPPVYADR